MIHKFLLNDEGTYDNICQKARGIRAMQRVLRDTFQSTVADSDIAVVVCMGGVKTFGRLVLCNQTLKSMLGYQNKDLRHQTIEMFMPEIMRTPHHEMIKNFNHSGQS